MHSHIWHTCRSAQYKEEQAVPPQANVPLSNEPGEAIQIDWGEVTYATFVGRNIVTQWFSW